MDHSPYRISATTDEQKKRIANALADTAISHRSSEITTLAQSCIQFTSVELDEDTAIGESRLGGLPDLPPKVRWHRGMSFMAQFSLSEIAAFDVNGLLPSKGFLYFFWDDECGFSDRGFSDKFVKYYSGDAQRLRREKRPPGYQNVDDPDYQPVDPEVIYNPYSLRFEPTVSLPSTFSRHFQSVCLDPTDKEVDAYFEIDDQFRIEARARRNGVSQFFGYPEDVGGAPDQSAGFAEMDCPPDVQWETIEKIDAKLAELKKQELDDWGKSDLRYHKDLRKKRLWFEKNEEKVLRQADEWVLLLELASDFDVGMCFSDAGRLQYFIRKGDLAKRRFGRIYASITSG